MEKNKELNSIFRLLGDKSLGEAMDRMASFGIAHPELGIEVPLKEIRADYDLMFDYWSRGYKDEQLERVYLSMTHRMYRLTADAGMRHAMAHSSFLYGIYNRVRQPGRDWSPEAVKASLEGFVSDIAMLELESPLVRETRKETLYRSHQQFMNDLFDYLWTSFQWTDGFVDSLEEMLLSPTIDTLDQQLVLSAVMLSTMNVFDIGKFRLLVRVYQNSTDERVRQRALVGWVLAMERDEYLTFPEERELVLGMLADERTRQELVELQIQMLYCLSAETDNRTIQKEIMPDLLKHNGLNITPNGIEEKEDSEYEDIFDSDASERNMEKVEESFRRMMNMQKAGSDIYFGGFSQMKRFPFFDSISNWFVPFYIEHPVISSIYSRMGDSSMVRNMVEHVPFCDSDKYSFVIAFQQVVDKIPQNVREMLGGNSLAGLDSMPKSDLDSPAYIRRIYLQDLYRFFRLYPSRSMFYNPFERSADGTDFNYVFFANNILQGTDLERHFGEVASCLTKRVMFDEAVGVLNNYSETARDYQYYMLVGNMLLRRPDAVNDIGLVTASDCFEEALRHRPDDEKALAGYARAMFYEGEYAEAADTYERLLKRHPGNRNFMLNGSVCLVNMELYDEALKILYKLDYEIPDDTRVNRVMARALMCTGKYDRAGKIYSELCGRESGCEDEDLVNYGFCDWFAGKKRDAAGHFAKYLVSRHRADGIMGYRMHFMADVVEKERLLLLRNGITPTEAHLMSDLVYEEIILA